VEDMDLFVTPNVATFKNILVMYPNIPQIFHFCCIHGNERKIKATRMLAYVICGKTEIKLLLGNAGNNEENIC
jgi:hypothetical protein